MVASANFDPVAGQWYQLTGVFDAAASTLSLYVDGTRQATVAAPTAWAGTGHLVIGRGKYGGNPVDYVDGTIDDVRAYTGALTAADAARLAIAGHWGLDEGTGTTTADDSLDPHTATLTGGAAWGEGVVGAHGGAFDGTDAAVDVPAPVVDTGQSFSVSAWVKPAAATGFRTAVSIDGSAISGFYLQRAADGRFAFTRRAADGDSASSSAVSALPAQADQWQHVMGVYNRAAGTLSLYVNGTLQQSVPFTTPWTASGHLVIGRGKWAGNPVDWFAGGIDDVRAYPTPLTGPAVAALAASGSWHFDEGAGTVAHDASANTADGTLKGATWTAGASGKAVQLDGKSTVDMGTSPAFDTGTGSLSLAGWFRTTASGTLVDHGDGYALGVTGGKLTARVGTIKVTTNGGGLADGNWHHAALVLDRAAQRLTVYADGDAAAVTSTCGTPTGTTLDVSACPASGTAAAPFTVGSGFTGTVDEVELRRFPLTAAQIGALAGANQLAVDANVVRANTRSTTYGSILEDISHSVEGGLYAELVRNRTFKEAYQGGSGAGNTPVPYWSLVTSPGATGSYAIDTANPLNTALDRSLKLHADAVPAAGRVAAANVGFYGIAAKPSTRYTGSFFAKGTWTGGLQVSLEKPDGTVLASKDLPPARGGLGAADVQLHHAVDDHRVHRQPDRRVAGQQGEEGAERGRLVPGGVAVPADLQEPAQRRPRRPRAEARGDEARPVPRPGRQLPRGQHRRHPVRLEEHHRQAGRPARPPEHRVGLLVHRRFRHPRLPEARRGHRRPAAARAVRRLHPQRPARRPGRLPAVRPGGPRRDRVRHRRRLDDVGREADRRRAPGAVRPALRRGRQRGLVRRFGQLRLALHRPEQRHQGEVPAADGDRHDGRRAGRGRVEHVDRPVRPDAADDHYYQSPQWFTDTRPATTPRTAAARTSWSASTAPRTAGPPAPWPPPSARPRSSPDWNATATSSSARCTRRCWCRRTSPTGRST